MSHDFPTLLDTQRIYEDEWGISGICLLGAIHQGDQPGKAHLFVLRRHRSLYVSRWIFHFVPEGQYLPITPAIIQPLVVPALEACQGVPIHMRVYDPRLPEAMEELSQAAEIQARFRLRVANIPACKVPKIYHYMGRIFYDFLDLHEQFISARDGRWLRTAEELEHMVSTYFSGWNTESMKSSPASST